MSESSEVVIRTEEEAFAWLEKYLEGTLDAAERENVRLENWPVLTVRLTGEKFDQSLTPSVMKGFIELQSAINRSIALSRSGEPNANLLSADERKALEIRVRVESGSSVLQVDFTGLLTTLGSKVISAMDPTTLAVTIVASAAVWGGVTVSKHFISERSRERIEKTRNNAEVERLNHLVAMSEEETKRIEIISAIRQQIPAVENAARLSDDARIDLLKALSSADTGTLAGIELDGEVAAELVKNARRQSEEVRLDGEYRILRNDTTDPDAFRVKVKNTKTQQEFEARVQDDTLTQSIKAALQDAEWGRTPIKLKINAKIIDENVRHAVVIGLAE